ncbi:IBR domain-containing protein [Colletotrichum karsti]|uniref:RBR-type E3 ubiquitin transferase n=1 Tax=Colletotrichum karsti TaxID=1095194 RepID=A0A9P6ICB7_9PEZI|nr:IBR domain-containing protein [Colletotrichum karsti]KAF9879757.1 IBR domain-containing protein [Colletotrichum karsti]
MSTATATLVKMEMASTLPSSLEAYAGFYGDPLLTLRDMEVKRKPVNSDPKGKGKALPDAPSIVESDPETTSSDNNNETDENVEWEEYNPPAALKTAPNVDNAVLLEVLQTSIENIQTRIAEERQRRQLEEEAKKQEEEDNAAEGSDDKAKEPYLPVIMPPDNPEPTSNAENHAQDENLKLFPELIGNGEGSSTRGLIVLPFKPKKRSRFALTRMFQKISEKKTGEKEGPLSAMKPFNFGGNSSKTSINTQSGESRTKLKKTATVECVSCLDDFVPKDVIKVTCHSYCHECFERLIATAVQNEQQWPPKCCLNDIPYRTILRYVSKDLGNTYKERSAELKIPVGDRIYCSEPDCGIWIKPDQVNRGLEIARCTNGHWTCIICRGPQHDNADCPQDRDMALTHALAEEEGWRRCGKCLALVEHREACQHMTCRCGYQFCYVCGIQWRSCGCTMDQLTAIKNGAAARREERRRRDLEAEEELRDALRQIEEFEREEARKLELLEQEMERLEEELRQRQLEERVRLESLRRHEVEVKYQELRELMNQLHDLQEVMVRYQHDKEVEILSHEASTATAELAASQQAELEELAEKASQKLAAKENALAVDYNCRVLKEKETEDVYLRKLEEFFAGVPSGEERIGELMLVFRKHMDEGWRAWSKWRHDEVARHKIKVEEERAIREEVMYSIKQRHEESLVSNKKETEKRQMAELRWVTLVIAERARMLADMETTELEDGDESLFSREEFVGEEGELLDSTSVWIDS